MTGRRAIFGLCIACALLVSAVAAQGASAATTAFTCAKGAPKATWSDAHCTSTVSTLEYGHVLVTKKTTITGASGTKFEGKQRLKATINGIVTELVATGVSGTGTMENTELGGVGGEMAAKGTGTITYTGVTVAKPAEKGCKVREVGGEGKEEMVTTQTLAAQTTNEMGLKFTPAVGTLFAKFKLEGCKGTEALEGLNKEYEVTGSIIGTPEGGETVSTHAGTTAQETLFVGPNKAGLEGSLTIKGENGNALTVTTPPYSEE
jgi:hypothetical protein